MLDQGLPCVDVDMLSTWHVAQMLYIRNLHQAALMIACNALHDRFRRLTCHCRQQSQSEHRGHGDPVAHGPVALEFNFDTSGPPQPTGTCPASLGLAACKPEACKTRANQPRRHRVSPIQPTLCVGD